MWSDSTPYRYNNIQTLPNALMTALLNGYTKDYLDEKHFDTVKEARKQHIEPKIRLAVNNMYLNTTDDSLCTAILVSLFTNYVWIHIPCDIQLTSNYFFCEKPITAQRNVSRVTVVLVPSCPKLYTHVSGACWSIDNTPRGRAPQINETIYDWLQPFLSAWSLGFVNRRSVVVNDTGSHVDCISTIGLSFQRVKNWVVTNCTQGSNKFYLVHKSLKLISKKCDTPRHFLCDDGSCLLSTYLCDGRFDCSDQSDENNCENNNLINNIKFQCMSGN